MLNQGFRVINVDESWLSETDMRRKKWGPRKGTNSMRECAISMRITFVAALDTNGKVYLSLAQRNSDTDSFCLFMTRLAKVLDGEDKNWRDNSVIQLDGARYHTNSETKEVLMRLGLPIIFAGPYGYDAAAAESLFAAMKSTELNPLDLSTGIR